MTRTKETPTEDVTAGIACSFCLKPTTEVATMVGGPGVFICNECVALCVELIETKPAVIPKLPSSKERVSDHDLLATLPKIAAAGTQVDRAGSVGGGGACSRYHVDEDRSRARHDSPVRVGTFLGRGVAAVSLIFRHRAENAVDRSRTASAESTP